MKKSFVALLLALAIIILVSPGIVGRLAEKSMDENLDWAAAESREVIVTSQGFERGWFSSEGQHRVEVRDGELRDGLLELVGGGEIGELPVLIIDTRLDHGIVPVTSMSRDKGSLMPGLGSAISTLSLEFEGGETIDLPGTVYSEVGFTGDLRSNLIVDADSYTHDSSTTSWGNSDIVVTTNPSGSAIEFSGEIESFSALSNGDGVRIGKIEFDGRQESTQYGIGVGNVRLSVASAELPAAEGSETIGPLFADTTAELDGDRVSGHSMVRLDNLPFGDMGPAGVVIDVTLTGMDAASLGNLARALEDASTSSGDEMMLAMEDDLQRLLASGFELRFDKIDLSLPAGTMTTQLNVELAETDISDFTWTAPLLALDASLDVSMPAELVEHATATDPQLNAAIAMGFLVKNGDVYEMQAAFRKGLLTVNGAPMPLPVPGLQ